MFTVGKNVRILKYSTYLKIYSKTYLKLQVLTTTRMGSKKCEITSKLHN